MLAPTRVRPGPEEVERRAAEGYTLVPVYRELLADMLTPAMAYLRLRQGGGDGFLLESVEGGERLARYSFAATDPRLTVTLAGGMATVRDRGATLETPAPDPLAFLRELMGRYRVAPSEGELPAFAGGLVGYLGYEVATRFERLPRALHDPLAMPEAELALVDTLAVFDHVSQRLRLLTHARLDGSEGDPAQAWEAAVARLEGLQRRLATPAEEPGCPGVEPPPLSANLSREEFEASVARAREYILAGDAFQVVLSRRLDLDLACDPFLVYRMLRAVNPSPYMYFLEAGNTRIIGTSPEILVRVRDREVSTRPLAGTRPRGATPEEDRRLEAELLADEKERAEHVMLVDLGRNDVGRVSRAGSVRVNQLMEVERYSNVMHIVSDVSGELAQGLDALDALCACFPAGTVSGAPKIRAMEIIAELEPDQRGAYSGALGYIGFNGNLDMAITIRTVVVRGARAHVQAGAGIVADSDPAAEFQETLNKAQALLRAVALAHRGLESEL
ncbi:MAG: anthranilate synthase component I [Candidatus Dormibacteria bacterium]